MKTITIDQIARWFDEPEDVFSGKDAWNALEILAREDIEIKDRFWIVLRPELLSESTMVEAACRFAEYAFSKAGNENVPHESIEAITAARAFVKGEISKKELEYVQFAALVAAYATINAINAANTNSVVSAAAASSAAYAVSVANTKSVAFTVATSASASATDAYEDMQQILIDVIKEYEGTDENNHN